MNKLTAFAYDFVSYISLQESLKKYSLRTIVIYGSAARGDYHEKSDIDLFIDVSSKKDLDKLKKEIDKTLTNFENSDRITKWELLGIKNDFSIIVGNLDNPKWDELRSSMHSHAITLWSKFSKKPTKLEPYVLIKWFLDAKNAKKRVQLSRKLNGYTQKGKKYPGLLEQIDCKRIARGIVIVKLEHVNTIRKILRELKIKYKLVELFLEK